MVDNNDQLQANLEDRFGDRFPGMHLSIVDELFWPVFDHEIELKVVREVALNPVEEGLLRFVRDGVSDKEEVGRFLGIGKDYLKLIITRLSLDSAQSIQPCLVEREGLYATQGTDDALDRLVRPTILEETVSVYRDALFGGILQLDDNLLEFADIKNSVNKPTRWLAALELPEWEEYETDMPELLETFAQTLDGEIIEHSVSSFGHLKWIRLLMGCYQRPDNRGGHFLLLNPADKDRPLDEESFQFEQLLLDDGPPKLYHRDDELRTGNDFWNAMCDRLKISDIQDHIVKVQEAVLPIKAKHDGGEKVTKKSVPSDEPTASETIDKANQVIEDLKKQITLLSKTRDLSAKEHVKVLLDVLENSQKIIIIISPWIKLKVLERNGILEGLASALKRGCEVWIGHEMPKSSFHGDKSDPKAIEKLDELARLGKFFRVDGLGTHEKVLISDNRLKVITSFNWLSYGGWDRRRERGTLEENSQKVEQAKNEYLDLLYKRLSQKSRQY